MLPGPATCKELSIGENHTGDTAATYIAEAFGEAGCTDSAAIAQAVAVVACPMPCPMGLKPMPLPLKKKAETLCCPSNQPPHANERNHMDLQ